jgi:hypothetical protein
MYINILRTLLIKMLNNNFYIYIKISTFKMEDYLTNLQKNSDGAYTLPADKFTVLLKRYSDMKKEINDCVEIKRECEILKQNKEHVQSQYFIILQLKNELARVRQEKERFEDSAQKCSIKYL